MFICINIETEIWGVEFGGEDDDLWVNAGRIRWGSWLARWQIGKARRRERGEWGLEPRGQGLGHSLVGCEGGCAADKADYTCWRRRGGAELMEDVCA